jgi:hypothetical protein
MKSESAGSERRRCAIDPCAFMNAPDNCEIELIGEARSANESVAPHDCGLRLMD